MAALQNHRGQPLTDADGQVLKVGSTVVDSMFGEGIARGTVSAGPHAPHGTPAISSRDTPSAPTHTRA